MVENGKGGKWIAPKFLNEKDNYTEIIIIQQMQT